MRLNPRQREVLEIIAARQDGTFTAWTLGRATCEALRKRGLIEGVQPIRRFYGDPYITITPAGRAALQEDQP
jgi:hypothetical protein